MLVNSYNISKTLNAYNSKCHLWTYALLALSLQMACASKKFTTEMEWQIVMIRRMSGRSSTFYQFFLNTGYQEEFFFKNLLHDITTWQHSFFKHPCYKTDFLFAIRLGPHSYIRYTLLNTQWTFCASLRKNKMSFFYLFICVLRKYIFCVQVYGKLARWGRYNLYFEALLLSLNIIKLIPLGASTSKYKKVCFLHVIIRGW